VKHEALVRHSRGAAPTQHLAAANEKYLLEDPGALYVMPVTRQSNVAPRAHRCHKAGPAAAANQLGCNTLIVMDFLK
jgi:hypothetical protein